MGNKVGWQMAQDAIVFFLRPLARPSGRRSDSSGAVVLLKIARKLTDMLRLFKRSVPPSCSRSV